jgi:hypothetical protein
MTARPVLGASVAYLAIGCRATLKVLNRAVHALGVAKGSREETMLKVAGGGLYGN